MAFTRILGESSAAKERVKPSIAPFETDRLMVNQIIENDSNDYYELFSAPDVAEYDEFTPISREDATEDVQRIMQNYANSENTEIELAVRVKTQAGLAGVLYMHIENSSVFIGYHFLSTFRGKGYAREAVSAFVEQLQASLPEYMIRAKVDSENTRSISLLEKCGFKREEGYNEKQFFKGKPHTEWQFTFDIK
jgi:RimJ/RimL family protein N-acetyltransferase